MKNKLLKIYKEIVLIIVIMSIFLGMFWYISLPFSIFGLIVSILQIKEEGNIISKISASIALVSIANCIMIYSIAFSEVIKAYLR